MFQPTVRYLLLALALAVTMATPGSVVLAQEPLLGPGGLNAPDNSYAPAHDDVLLTPATPEEVFSGSSVELPTGDQWQPVGPTNFVQGRRGPSWCTKPLYVDLLVGPINGSDLERGKVLQDRVGVMAGAGFGYDIGSHWGIEKRFGYAALQIADRDHSDRRTSTSLFGEYRGVFYPLGDRPLRPYLTAGVGGADFEYRDSLEEHHRRGAFLVPFGGGVKYLLCDRVALRAEIIDDFTCGTRHLAPMHNVSLLGGVEIRFCKPQLHWPDFGKTTCRWLWQ